MKAARRWFIYRRLATDFNEASDGSLVELGTCRTAILEFAWRFARAEVERDASAARHRREAGQPTDQDIQGRQSRATVRR